jgi:hypothetical protein
MFYEDTLKEKSQNLYLFANHAWISRLLSSIQNFIFLSCVIFFKVNSFFKDTF